MANNEGDRPLRVAVLGAGPVGLDAALAGLDAGYEVNVYDAGGRPSNNVRDWGHVRLFSPWSMNVSQRMRRHATRVGLPLDVDDEAFLTGHDLADRLLDPLWARARPRSSLHLGTRVVAVGREGLLKHEEIGSPERGRRPFRILLCDADGREWVESADVVLDCTGKYGNPNTLGDGGIPAPGEQLLGVRIERRIPDLRTDAREWLGRMILLAGAGHSAQTAARDLAELASDRQDTRVLWALRKPRPDWGAVRDDPLPERQELTSVAESLSEGASPVVESLHGVVVEGLYRDNGRIGVRLRNFQGQDREIRVDKILSLTGAVGDHTLYRQLQVHECYATSGPMKLAAALLGSDAADCLAQESHGVDTLKNPEPNFFLLGDKSYGRNSTFLLRVGWQQVEEVFEELSRRS